MLQLPIFYILEIDITYQKYKIIRNRNLLHTREIDCPCCPEIEVDAIVIISAKISQCEESISPPRVSLIWVDEFYFLFLV